MIDKKKLPKYWETKNLSDLIGENGVFCDGDWIESKDQDKNGEVRLIQLADIRDGYFRDKSDRHLTRKRANELNCTFLNQSDILVARMPDPLGRCCLFPLKGENKYVTVVDVAIIRTDENICDKKFLGYIINSPQIRNAIDHLESGTTRKRISRKNLNTIEFPIPPLTEQQAIVSKIEELLSDLENGKQQLQTAQQQLKTYRQSLLKWAFEGRFGYAQRPSNCLKDGELPKGWKWVKIIDIVENNKNSLKAGPFGSSLKKEFYVQKGYKIYGQEQVISDDAFLGDYFINEEKYQELKSCKIKPLDILISLVGTVGKVLILPENCKEGIINPRLIKISLNKGIYLPKFFKHYFESSSVKNFYGSKAQGTTMDVLNLGIIKTIPFPLPSLSEQQHIVDELESKLTVCDKIEEAISQSLQQAETLRQSILKKAFEGKL
ncbi:MAG: restriction endonuclease subunit S [Bacteroidales bacterium]